MRAEHGATLQRLCLEARYEGIYVLSNRRCSSAVFCRRTVHSVFASPIPPGELIRFLAQCSRFSFREVQGFSRTDWDLFVAAGFSVGVFFLFAAILAWQLRWPSGSDFSAHARHCVGVRPLLCRHHGCELEIPLYPPYRFLTGDYGVFDCRGMAFRAANLKLIRMCSSLRCDLTSPSLHINAALNFAAQLPFRETRATISAT